MPRKRVKRTIGLKKTKLQLMKQSKLGKTLRTAAAVKSTAVSSDELLNVDSEMSDNETTANVDNAYEESGTVAVVDMELDPDIHCDGVGTEEAENGNDQNGATDVNADSASKCASPSPTPNESESNLNVDETVLENLCEENAENNTESQDQKVNRNIATTTENTAENVIEKIQDATIGNNDTECDSMTMLTATGVTTTVTDNEENREASVNVDEQETAMTGIEYEEHPTEDRLVQGEPIYEITEIDTVEVLDVEDDDENNANSGESDTKNTQIGERAEAADSAELSIIDTKTASEGDPKASELRSEPEVVDIVDSKEENGEDVNQGAAGDAEQSGDSLHACTANPISDAIVREAIDLNLDSADLEILDERVERSINAEIEKENQMVQEAKNSKVSKENSCKQSLTSSTVNAAGDKKKTESRRNLWVCNIPSSTRANDLKQTFAKYGKVVGAKIVVNTRSPGSKYYGYVTMDTEKDASNCIKFLNNSNFNGQKITIEKVNSEKDVTLNNGGSGSGSGPKSKTAASPTALSGEAAKTREKSYEKNGGQNSRNSSVSKATPNNDRNGTSAANASSSSGDHAKRDVSRTRSTSKSSFSTPASIQREIDREKQRIKDKLRAEFQAEMTRERDRLARLEERLRLDMDARQKHMERRMRDEERRLERERDELRKEREKLEKEKNELWRLEREKARQEREKLEREREELKRQKKMIDEENSRSLKRSAPSPPQIRSASHVNKDAMRRDLIDDMVPPPPSKRRYDSQTMADSYDRVAPSASLSSMGHKDDRLPKGIDVSPSYSKYDSEAAMYLARIERENRSGPKDLRYTLMESASYRNAPLEPPAPPTNLDRKSRDHSHRYLDDSPKEHMSSSRSAYDRPVRPSSPLNKFHSQSSAPPPHWNSSRSMNNSAGSGSGGGGGASGIGSGISSSSDSLRWSQPSTGPGSSCRMGSAAGAGGSSSSASQPIYPNSSSLSRQHQNPMAMHQQHQQHQQQQQQPQSPWSNSQAPSTADYNVHGNISSNNNYPMSSYDNYKSSMSRNKY